MKSLGRYVGLLLVFFMVSAFAVRKSNPLHGKEAESFRVSVSADHVNIGSDELHIQPTQGHGLQNASVRDFGAKCDGLSDDTKWVTVMGKVVGRVAIPEKCTLRIATTVSLLVPIAISQNGMLKVDGAVLTIGAPIMAASPVQIYAPVNGGSVVYTTAQDRYPEQWGAIPNNLETDNTVAINASIAAGRGNIILTAPMYAFTGPLVDMTPGVHLIGVGDQATSLIQKSSTENGINFGALINTTAPALPPAIVQLYSSLEHVTLIRASAPIAGLGSAPYNAAAKGVSIQAVGWVTLNDVHVYGSRIGIYRRHTNNTFTQRVISEFDFTNTYGGSTAVGGDALNFYIDSQDSNSGSTANASSTDTDDLAICDNGQAGASSISAAYFWRGNFSDYFGQKLQSAGCNGVAVDGSGADVTNGGALHGSNAGTGNVFTNDFEIVDLIVDGFRDYGIRVINVPANFPRMGFDGGYLLNGYTGASRAVDIESNGVSLEGSWSIDAGESHLAALGFCVV